MSMDKADNRSSRADDQSFREHDKAQGPMTPARQAALDALERELRAILRADIKH
jgi:hypothetical protein